MRIYSYLCLLSFHCCEYHTRFTNNSKIYMTLRGPFHTAMESHEILSLMFTEPCCLLSICGCNGHVDVVPVRTSVDIFTCVSGEGESESRGGPVRLFRCFPCLMDGKCISRWSFFFLLLLPVVFAFAFWGACMTSSVLISLFGHLGFKGRVWGLLP